MKHELVSKEDKIFSIIKAFIKKRRKKITVLQCGMMAMGLSVIFDFFFFFYICIKPTEQLAGLSHVTVAVLLETTVITMEIKPFCLMSV